MKKLLLAALITIGASVTHGQFAVLSTNLNSGTAFLLTTNRAAVYSVEISSPTAGVVKLFDQDSLAAPYYGSNYTTSAYPYRSSYTTNIASSYVGNNGVTNWTTNSGIYSITLTNAAATNALSASFAAAIGANQAVIHTTDAVFTRGISVVAAGVTNGSITVYYRPGQ